MNVKESWKPVTISGTTGILMGAGTMYGMQIFDHTGEEPTTPSAEGKLKVTNTDDGVSFKEAFDTARAEQGPGGVFTWRGNIYNTYTADEWQGMSDADKQQFASRVKPFVNTSDVATSSENVTEDVTVAETGTEEVDENVVEVVPKEVVEEKADDVAPVEETDTAHENVTSWDDLTGENNDVRIIGYKDIEISNGKTVTMQGLEVNGQRVAIIDIDKDGEPDLAMSDLNHNFQMDEGEVIDLHTGEALTFTNEEYTANTNDIDMVDGGVL